MMWYCRDIKSYYLMLFQFSKCLNVMMVSVHSELPFTFELLFILLISLILKVPLLRHHRLLLTVNLLNFVAL